MNKEENSTSIENISVCINCVVGLKDLLHIGTINKAIEKNFETDSSSKIVDIIRTMLEELLSANIWIDIDLIKD